MNDETDNSSLLVECLGQGRKLSEMIEYADGAIVSKTILQKKTGTITLFAFDKGQKLSEHQSPFDAVVQVVEGKARLTIGGEENQVQSGDIIIMPANVLHAVAAGERFKMLLTMIRS